MLRGQAPLDREMPPVQDLTDGFLMMKQEFGDAGAEQISERVTLILNWFQELTERVPLP